MIEPDEDDFRSAGSVQIHRDARYRISDPHVPEGLRSVVLLAEKVPNLRHTNQVIGAYVTSGGENSSVRLSRQTTKRIAVLRHRLFDLHTAGCRAPAG